MPPPAEARQAKIQSWPVWLAVKMRQNGNIRIFLEALRLECCLRSGSMVCLTLGGLHGGIDVTIGGLYLGVLAHVAEHR